MRKTITFSILLFISIFSFSQKKSKKDCSTIYLMRSGLVEESGAKSTVFIGNQKGIELPSGGAVEFSMVSEGITNIFVQFENDDKNYFCKLKLKKGKEYYVCINKDNIEEVSYDFVYAFLKKKKGQIEKKEEDINITQPQHKLDADYSTIYIISKTGGLYSDFTGAVYIADQSPFNITPGSVVTYRVYSEGEVSVTARYSGVVLYTSIVGNLFATLNIKRGNEYYLSLTRDELIEISKDEAKIKSDGSFERRKENIDSPINPNSLKTPKSSAIQGTCFLISSEGYIITNFHCIENSKSITIKGIDGDFSTSFGATIIASDPTNDLALLKVNNKNAKFNTPAFGIRNSGVMQGEKVYALGFPKASSMGEEIKITEGIISALSGIKKDISNFQISAAVNPGNSGGPLIDESGNLIGIIYAKSTIAESAGYAIKASYLEAFLKNIEELSNLNLVNTIKEKPLTEKIKELKNSIYIVESN